MERSSKTSASGIIDDPNAVANGLGAKQRIIPESRRADGSIRKERKVRPGFTPVEDIARFVPSRVRQARAEAAASNGSKTSTNSVASRQTRSSIESNKSSSTPAEAKRSDKRPEIESESSLKASDATSKTGSHKESLSKASSTNGKDKHIKKPSTIAVIDTGDDDDQSIDKTEREEDGSVDEIAKELQSINIKSGSKS